MKKFLFSTTLALCILAMATQAFAYQITTNIKTKRIPAGTKLEIKTANNISTENATVGDMFNAYLTRDVRTETTMILPKGTVVRGNISKITDAKRLSRAGILYLNFDHVVAPNGTQIPIKAGITDGTFNLDINGGIKGGEGYGKAVQENLDEAGKIITKTTKWGITSGEELFKGGKYLVTPFAAVGGAFAGAGYFVGTDVADLFKKGNQVLIKKDTVFDILLLEPLDVPISE